jgi:hypothetical protein
MAQGRPCTALIFGLSGLLRSMVRGSQPGAPGSRPSHSGLKRLKVVARTPERHGPIAAPSPSRHATPASLGFKGLPCYCGPTILIFAEL